MSEPKRSLDTGVGQGEHPGPDTTAQEKETATVDASAGDYPPPLFVVPSNPGPDQDLERHASAATDGGESYPEGGLQAWLVVLGAWLALVSSLGIMNTLATFQSYLMTHQLAGYDEGTVGWIFSIYTFMVFFLGLYIGPLFDKYGPRWLILTGTLFVSASLMLFSISTGEFLPSHLTLATKPPTNLAQNYGTSSSPSASSAAQAAPSSSRPPSPPWATGSRPGAA